MKTMKKAIALLLVLFTLASLCACGNLEGTVVEPALGTDTAGKVAEPAEEAEPTSDETGETVEEVPALDTLTIEETAALVIIDGKFTPYKTMAEAWSAVNASVDKSATIIFYSDWIAEDGKFGSGDGYGETGNLTPKDRANDDIMLIINLNGHTLDRNLQEPQKSGNIISLKKDGTFLIENGTLTGGNTSDRGGAVWIDNDETTVYLDNLTITGNHANGNGGAIFVKECLASVTVTDCEITGNSSDNYGGAMYVSVGATWPVEYHATIELAGKVTINDNTGKDNRNNVCLQTSGAAEARLSEICDLKEGSVVYLAYSDFLKNEILDKDPPSLDQKYHIPAQCIKSDNPDLYTIYYYDSVERIFFERYYR